MTQLHRVNPPIIHARNIDTRHVHARVSALYKKKEDKKIMRIDDVVEYRNNQNEKQTGNVLDVLDDGRVVIETDDGEEIERKQSEVKKLRKG